MTAPPSEAACELSFVVPCHNEEANLRPLIAALRAVVQPLNLSHEIVLTDDCSSDRTWAVIRELAAGDPSIRGQRFAFNCGQSAAMWAGIQAARGKVIVTLDADLQNDPRDLPALLEALKRYDCACGSRAAVRRQSDGFVKMASSRIANWVRNQLSGENISDAGSCFRAFKRECLADLKFFKGMHRFMPTLVKLEGFTVTEVPIRVNPRTAGTSHYGVWNRLFVSFHDLLAVRWMKKRMFKYQVAERTD
jgi:dolichol-phosphate mannosyltransferase